MKKISKLLSKIPFVIAVGSLVSTSALVSCSKEDEPIDENDTSIYRLQFNDYKHLGKNTAYHSSFVDAKVVGEGFMVAEEYKNSHVLNFHGGKHNSNYLELPTRTLKNSETTIAMWVRMPSTLDDTVSNLPLFGFDFDGGHFYVSPFDKETWNSYAIRSQFGAEGEVNLTKVPASEEVFEELAPMEGTLQTPANCFQLIGFSFTSTGLRVYQNGKLFLTYSGDYSLSNKQFRSFKVGSAEQSQRGDFIGSISDIRIYDKVLDEDDYKKEFQTNYNDFKTLNLGFNNGNLSDDIRGFNGTVLPEAQSNVIFQKDEGRDIVYLNGKGDRDSKERSGFYLPKQTLLGHNELTISADIKFKPRINQDRQFLRLFDLSSNDGKRFLSFYYTLYDTNRMRLEVIPNQNKEFETPWVTNPDFIMPIEQWINLTFTFSNKATKIYVDGKLIAENETAIFSPSYLYDYDNCSFFIGRSAYYGDFALECFLDNFSMYSVALTDFEVQDMLGRVFTEDDNEAVNNIVDNFNITSCVREGRGRIYPVKNLNDGVKAQLVGHDSVIDDDGYIYYKNYPQTTTVTIRFSRNEVSKTKKYTISLPARSISPAMKNNDFINEKYADDSGLSLMQEANFDWMLSLNNNSLLHSYRLIADLPAPGESYGSWIREGCGGEGQFQAEYIGALARATNYESYSRVDEIREKLLYLLTEIRECQLHYPFSQYADPSQAGYLNAFTNLCFYGMEHGLCSHVGYNSPTDGKIRKQDGFNVPYDIQIWVPFYMYHKQLMMCYDTYTYANMGNEKDTLAIKELARTMFIEAATWMKKEVLKLTPEERECALRVEWGGMAEAMYLAYRLTGDRDFVKTAHFFEEDGLIEDLYLNKNPLPGIHTNTTLPKLISCCAAYEIMGDPFYLTAAMNVWDMMVNHMTMANGGISCIGEHYEAPDHSTQARFGEETCCSYNMLRLTDYLYRLTGNAKYMYYFEKVLYNHILPSIDMVGSYDAGEDNPYPVKHLDVLQKAGKGYVMSTDFGHHNVYSSNEDSFWCCVATGTESYSKLTYGNFYLDKEKNLYVNMYNNIETTLPDGKNIAISGIKFDNANKGNEYVEVTTTDDNVELNKIKFIKPTWVAQDPVMTINDTAVDYDEHVGYMTINGDKKLSEGQTLKITLPMKISVVEQRGYEGTEERPYSYALYYGPYMLVLDLGKQNDDVYIHIGNGSDQSGQHSYAGSLTQDIKLIEGQTFDQSITKKLQNPEITSDHAYYSGMVFEFATDNQSTLTFRPFMDINYERYSFYMYYNQLFQ